MAKRSSILNESWSWERIREYDHAAARMRRSIPAARRQREVARLARGTKLRRTVAITRASLETLNAIKSAPKRNTKGQFVKKAGK